MNAKRHTRRLAVRALLTHSSSLMRLIAARHAFKTNSVHSNVAHNSWEGHVDLCSVLVLSARFLFWGLFRIAELMSQPKCPLMWFEERSWSNLRMSELVEEWRDLWSFKVDFMVAAISYVFATANFLNLPKLILENGGLAFVAAYGAALLVLVLPTIVLELAVGQLTGRAPVQAFYHLSPVFKGLPWLNCKYFPELLSAPCRDAGSMANFTLAAHTKLSTVQTESSLVQFMSSLERPSSSIADFGDFQYYILAAQGLVWIIVFCGICFGVRWLGKVIPFSFMAAFSMLLALLIRACTMDGLMSIFKVYLNATDWNRLADFHIWKKACEQAILATGIGFGAFITMGSYNRRSNNLVGDSILIILGHALLTLMQVVTVIGLVGFVVSKTGLQPADVMDTVPPLIICVGNSGRRIGRSVVPLLPSLHSCAVCLQSYLCDFPVFRYTSAHRLGMDLHVMLRQACCWCLGHFILYFTYLLPIIPAGVAVLNLHGYDYSTFSPAIHAWPWSEWVGAAVALVPLLPIPLFLIFTILGACCCRGKQGYTRGQRLRSVFASRLRKDHRDKSAPPPRYTGTAPGYLLLPQAPLAEPETYA
ncbi:Sodium:neurotransmitter symporter family protein [Ancylostoma ceylanicum]|uniref:Sodium:neurotransmitter symporter family protein n=1 Tax=Ancylostoma ceylanicum TaxID=53326 RepID=A0A0D6LM67_9BILA|nr:Sodium:neurotransmitter symporter family protein [Ancylostoma ceylanicum]